VDRTYFHYNLAVIYEALNDIDNAQAEIEKAIEKTIWAKNRATFTSYKEYLGKKAVQRPQITNVYSKSLEANAPKVVVLKFQASDENGWKIASDFTSTLTLLGKYTIYGRDKFLELLKGEEISIEALSQIMGVDYIVSGTLKKPPGIILQTTSDGSSIEKAFCEIRFSITDTKTGTVKAIETISGEYPMRMDLSRERLLYEARIDAIDKFVRKISSIIN